MIQLIVAQSAAAYADGFTADGALNKGAIAFLDKLTKIDTEAQSSPTTSIGSVIGIGVGSDANKLNIKTSFTPSRFRFTKTEYAAAVKTKYTLLLAGLVGKVREGDDYVLTIALKGDPKLDGIYQKGIIVTATNTDTSATVATKLVKSINGKFGDKVIAAVDGSVNTTITIEALVGDTDFTVSTAKYLGIIVPTRTTNGSSAINDVAYMEALWLKTIANNGNLYTHEANDMYTKPTFTGTYTTFNLFFQSPRIGRQTVDENVTQQVIIAIPTGSAAIATVAATLTKIMNNTLTIVV